MERYWQVKMETYDIQSCQVNRRVLNSCVGFHMAIFFFCRVRSSFKYKTVKQRFQIQACQVSPFTRSIFELKSLLTPQSCSTKSHYQSRDCQPAVMTAGNLGNPAFLGKIFAS